MELVIDYIVSVFVEGILIGMVFWLLVYITVESSSLWGAVRSALLAEIIGNLPYLWDLPATTPPSILMSLLSAIIFVRLVVRVGELSMTKAVYGTAMTYFVLVALVTCNG